MVELVLERLEVRIDARVLGGESPLCGPGQVRPGPGEVVTRLKIDHEKTAPVAYPAVDVLTSTVGLDYTDRFRVVGDDGLPFCPVDQECLIEPGLYTNQRTDTSELPQGPTARPQLHQQPFHGLGFEGPCLAAELILRDGTNARVNL